LQQAAAIDSKKNRHTHRREHVDKASLLGRHGCVEVVLDGAVRALLKGGSSSQQVSSGHQLATGILQQRDSGKRGYGNCEFKKQVPKAVRIASSGAVNHWPAGPSTYNCTVITARVFLGGLHSSRIEDIFS
jgi:hypothetical protein